MTVTDTSIASLRPAAQGRDYGAVARFSRRIVLAYCAIFYALPFLIFIFMGNPLEDVMVRQPSYWAGLAYVIFSVGVFYWATSLPVVRLHIPKIGLSDLLFNAQFGLIFAVIFALFSYWARSFLGLNFRQSGVSLADVGAMGFLLEVFKMTAGVMILVNYRLIADRYEAPLRSAAMLLIAAGFFFSIQAAYDIVFVVCALVASGVRWNRFFGFHIRLVRVLSVVALPLIAYGALFIGTANKIGIDRTWELLTHLPTILNLVVGRVGYHFYSTSIQVTDNFTNFYQAELALAEVWNVIKYRFSVLTGLISVEKPDVGTISRMNFLYMSPAYHPRIGASPSLLGSVFFWPGAGFAIFYFVFLMRFVLLQFWTVVGDRGLNWLFGLLVVILFGSIFDASLDTLNPFSHGAVRLIVLILAARYVSHRLG